MSETSRFRQRGQALVVSLVLLFAGALGLVLLFDGGQVVADKQRLTNAADAAALSAATWRARVLNFDAYANRAIVAQEVAIAQAVTLTSWSRYFENFIDTVGTVLSIVFPVSAPFFAYASDIAEAAREATETAAAIETWLRGAETVGYKNLLASAQEVMHVSAGTFGLGAVAAEIARANDRRFFAFALPDGGDFERFTRRYDTDEDRQRLRTVVVDSLDRFVTNRSLDHRTPLPSGCAGTTADPDTWFRWLRKRGGTVLAPDLERWEAADTLAMHDFRRRGFFFSRCREEEETPLGWGAAEAGPEELDGALIGNPGDVRRSPRAAELAEDELSDAQPMTYSGITRIRELDYAALETQFFPRSRVAVLARIEGGDVAGSGRIGANAGRLRLPNRFEGGRQWALGAAEVYFRRPPTDSPRIEYASLFNPYWQARLREPTFVEREAARAYAR